MRLALRLAILLLSLIGCPTMASAALPALQCSLQGPSTAAPGQPVMLRLQLHNTGPQAVQVLRWGTPFEAAWFAAYVAVYRDGQELPYGGAKMKRGNPDASQYLRIAAGAAETATVDLAAVFDIATPGHYRVQPRLVLHDVVVGEAAQVPRPLARHQRHELPCADWAFDRTR